MPFAPTDFQLNAELIEKKVFRRTLAFKFLTNGYFSDPAKSGFFDYKSICSWVGTGLALIEGRMNNSVCCLCVRIKGKKKMPRTDEHIDLLEKLGPVARQLMDSHLTDRTGLSVADREVLLMALEAVSAAEAKISQQHKRIQYLENLSMSDEITGLLNLRGFKREVTRAIGLAKRYGYKAVMVYCDLDGFKAINDQFGHAAGDAVLAEVGEILNTYVRNTDVVARLGGDEFAMLLVEADPDKAALRVRALEAMLNSHIVDLPDGQVLIQASVGMTNVTGDTSVEEILNRADQDMYEHKRERKASIKT